MSCKTDSVGSKATSNPRVIFNLLLTGFYYLTEESSGNKKIPPLFREMGFRRPSAIRHPKGLWLIEIWQGQAFKANTTKLRENVKFRLQKKPAARIATWQGHL
jgi:hypothetical protein